MRQPTCCGGGVVPRVPAIGSPTIDLSPVRKALALLTEALAFRAAQPDGTTLKPHWRSAVIRSFEFSHEGSVWHLCRARIERAEPADRVADLSFNDLLRAAAEAGLLADAPRWREMNNATRHSCDEARALAVAQRTTAFAEDAVTLPGAPEAGLAR